MGYDMARLEVVASLSRHNINQDDVDDALWEELYERVVQICQEKKFQSIRLMVV